MTGRIGGIGCVAAACCLASGVTAAPTAELPQLAPYQMVRSLQLAQDRIADGDQAALPMQKRMIEMIDQRFDGAAAEEFADHRNVDALMIYGMSGGNPRTFERVTDRLHLDEKDRDMAAGILAYVHSDPGKAARLLAPVSPENESHEVGAFLALIKGTVRSIDHPSEGLELLDRARLMAPGSLVEEAALRRSLTLAADTHDPARFLRAAEQYVRRFLKSPYASHFADGFINGVLAMPDVLDMARVKSIIGMMNADQQTAVYLRIARASAIKGRTDLAEFASSGAEGVDGGPDRKPDPRAELYNALATVTSDSIGTVSERLARIDPRDLSKRDERLLDAAKEVVRNVMADPIAGVPAEEQPVENQAGPAPEARPAMARPEPVVAMPPKADGKAAATRADARPMPAAGKEPATGGENPAQPKVRVVRTERIPVPQDNEAAAAVPAGDLKQPSMERMGGDAEATQAEPPMELVVETRKKLDEIDKLLAGSQP